MIQTFRQRVEEAVAGLAARAGLDASLGSCTDDLSVMHVHLPRRLDCAVRLVARFYASSFHVIILLPGDEEAGDRRGAIRAGMPVEGRSFDVAVTDGAACDRMLAAVAATIAQVTRPLPTEGELREALQDLMFKDRRAAADAVMAVATGAGTMPLLAAAIRERTT